MRGAQCIGENGAPGSLPLFFQRSPKFVPATPECEVHRSADCCLAKSDRPPGWAPRDTTALKTRELVVKESCRPRPCARPATHSPSAAPGRAQEGLPHLPHTPSSSLLTLSRRLSLPPDRPALLRGFPFSAISTRSRAAPLPFGPTGDGPRSSPQRRGPHSTSAAAAPSGPTMVAPTATQLLLLHIILGGVTAGCLLGPLPTAPLSEGEKSFQPSTGQTPMAMQRPAGIPDGSRAHRTAKHSSDRLGRSQVLKPLHSNLPEVTLCMGKSLT